MYTQFQYNGELVTIHGSERDHIFRSIDTAGTFYEREMLEHARSTDLQGTVIDVGANIGNHTVFFGMFTSVEQVIAVEPHQPAAEYLRDNIAVNHLGSKVTQLACALGTTNGTVGLKPGPARNMGHTKVTSGDDIELARLDDIATSDVSLLKIDVEGYELEVLTGGIELLGDQRPVLFIEAANLFRKRRIDKFLRRFGYQAVARFNGKPTYLYTPQPLV